MPQVSTHLVRLIRNMCELETYMVSVERIQEYSGQETEVLAVATQKKVSDWRYLGTS